MDNKNTVTVKIYGQEYSISGDMPREYIIKLADYVDSKMQEVGACGNIPVSGVAVLTAVNMADDYFNLKKQAGDSEKYEMMWEDVKQSFARSREELEAVNAQAAELRRASIDKDKQLSELYGENSELKKNNEVLRNRIAELAEAAESAQAAPLQAQQRIAELEAKCRDTESSFFDIQMENIRLKNELDTLKRQTGRY